MVQTRRKSGAIEVKTEEKKDIGTVVKRKRGRPRKKPIMEEQISKKALDNDKGLTASSIGTSLSSSSSQETVHGVLDSSQIISDDNVSDHNRTQDSEINGSEYSNNLNTDETNSMIDSSTISYDGDETMVENNGETVECETANESNCSKTDELEKSSDQTSQDAEDVVMQDKEKESDDLTSSQDDTACCHPGQPSSSSSLGVSAETRTSQGSTETCEEGKQSGSDETKKDAVIISNSRDIETEDAKDTNKIDTNSVKSGFDGNFSEMGIRSSQNFKSVSFPVNQNPTPRKPLNFEIKSRKRVHIFHPAASAFKDDDDYQTEQDSSLLAILTSPETIPLPEESPPPKNDSKTNKHSAEDMALQVTPPDTKSYYVASKKPSMFGSSSKNIPPPTVVNLSKTSLSENSRKEASKEELERRSSKERPNGSGKDDHKKRDNKSYEKSSPTENEKASKSSSEESTKIPNYELISECKYLTKNASKKKTESLICFCYENEDNCSTSSCVNRAMLTECPSTCPAKGCKNQRFAKRKYSAVAAFHTGTRKGFGLKALKDIKRGEFIIEYVGELLEREDYEKRKKKYAADKTHKHHYLCDTDQYTIDATSFGNPSRFINHSCEPNAVCEKWSVPKTPGDVSRIGFFAKRFIKADEEITFDYQFVNYGRDAQQCFCGTPSCNGWIGQKLDYSSSENESESDDEEIQEHEASEDEISKILDMNDLERKDEIDKILDGLILKNRKHSGKVIRLAEIMTDAAQKKQLIKNIFSQDMPFQLQLHYAKDGMMSLMSEWITRPDYSLANLKLTQKLLQVLHGEVFLGLARDDRDLLDVVSSLAKESKESSVPEGVAVQVTVDSLVEAVENKNSDYSRIYEKKYNETISSFHRISEMAVRLNHHWFNRSVNFRIPKKVHEQKKEFTEFSETKEEEFHNYYHHHHHRYDRYRDYSKYSGRYQRRNKFGNFYDRKRHYFNNYGFKRRQRRSRSRSRSVSPYYKRKRYDDNRSKSPDRFYNSKPATENEVSPPIEATKYVKNEPIPKPVTMTPTNVPTNMNPPMHPFPFGFEPPPPFPFPGPPPPFFPIPHPSMLPHAMMNDYNEKMTEFMANWEASMNAQPTIAKKEAENIASLPTLDRLELIYEKATEDELRKRLDEVNKEIHLIHKKLVLKETERSKVDVSKVEIPAAPPSTSVPDAPTTKSEKYAWAKAKSDKGEIYYYNKITKETQWTPPRPDQGELDPACELTVDELNRNGSVKPAADDKPMEPSLSARIGQLVNNTAEESEAMKMKEKEEKEREMAQKRLEKARQREAEKAKRLELKTREFKINLEKLIAPIVISYLKNVPETTAEKTTWLIKLVVKEMFRRESLKEGFDFVFNETVAKMVRKYTESYMERKLRNGSTDIWKTFYSVHSQ